MTLPKFVDQSKPSFNQMLRAMHNRDLEAGTSQEAKQMYTYRPTPIYKQDSSFSVEDDQKKRNLIPVYRNTSEDFEKEGTHHIEAND